MNILDEDILSSTVVQEAVKQPILFSPKLKLKNLANEKKRTHPVLNLITSNQIKTDTIRREDFLHLMTGLGIEIKTATGIYIV